MSKSTGDVRVIVTEFNIDAIDDEWESLVSAAIPIVKAHDENRWALGSLGAKAERRYGESSLGKFSRVIGLKSPTIMYDYVTTFNFYSAEDQAAFPPLTWSHYRAAMRVKSRELAMTWLAKAADEDWTVDDLIEAIRVKDGGDPKPQKVIEIGGQFWECRPVTAEGSSEVTGYDLVFRVASEVDVLTPRGVYTVKVFGARLDEDDE